MKKMRPPQKFRLKAICFAAGLSLILLASLLSHTTPETLPSHSSRRLLEEQGGSNITEGSCIPYVSYAEIFPYPYTGHPGVFVAELFGIFYTFLGLALVCDEYFVASLEKISEAFNLSPDVAGATFMAAGSSAPELFTSLAASLKEGSPAGFGTIVGSGIFNITFVYGIAIWMSGSVLVLDWRPLVRDSFFYILATIVLFCVFLTGDEVLWYEALLMLFLYACYVLMMKFNHRLMQFLDHISKISDKINLHGVIETEEGDLMDEGHHRLYSRNPAQLAFVRNVALLYTFNAISPEELQKAGLHGNFAPSIDPESSAIGLTNVEGNAPASESSNLQGRDEEDQKKEEANKEEEEKKPDEALEAIGEMVAAPAKPKGIDRFKKAVKAVAMQQRAIQAFTVIPVSEVKFPKTWGARIFYIISWPLVQLFHWTILDCRKKRFEKLYFVTFITSLIWIAIFAHFMVAWAGYVGCFLRIPEAILGLTLLAVGTSVPEVVTSVSIAKQGLGDMIIANSLGSNVFDILIGLGLPWFIFSLARGPIKIDPTGLLVYIGIAFSALLSVIILFAVQGFKVKKVITSSILVGIYGLFLLLGILFAFPSNGPVIDLSKVPSITLPSF